MMALMVKNQTQLVAAARRGDPQAMSRLIDAWLPVVLGWCNRLAGPKVDAEDAAHDVFVKVLTRLDTIRSEDHFGAWLFGVTRGVLTQHRRRAWIRKWVPGFVPDAVDNWADPFRDHERGETARRVQLALEKLPPLQREVIVLCDIEERTAAEVSVLIGASVGTVKSRLRLGRERFRLAAKAVGLGPVLLAARDRGEL